MGLAGAAAAVSAAATVASTASSVLGGSGQSSAISSGLSQANALDEAARQEGRDSLAFDRANAQPFITQGTTGLNRFADLLGVNGKEAATTAMSGFTQSPGYQWTYDQAMRGVDAGAASKGMLRSGATIKAEQGMAAGLASQEFGNYVGRLNSLAGFGLQGAGLDNQSTATFNNLLSRSTTDQTGNITGAATNQASIYGRQAQSIGDGVGSLLGIAKKNGLFDVAGSAVGAGGAPGQYSGGNTFNSERGY